MKPDFSLEGKVLVPVLWIDRVHLSIEDLRNPFLQKADSRSWLSRCPEKYPLPVLRTQRCWLRSRRAHWSRDTQLAAVWHQDCWGQKKAQHLQEAVLSSSNKNVWGKCWIISSMGSSTVRSWLVSTIDSRTVVFVRLLIRLQGASTALAKRESTFVDYILLGPINSNRKDNDKWNESKGISSVPARIYWPMGLFA